MNGLEPGIFAAHLLGTSLVVGTLFVQFKAKYGFRFDLVLIGASVQLATILALYGIAIADGNVNHVQFGLRTLFAVVAFAAGLTGYLRERNAKKQKANLADGGAVGGLGVTSAITDPTLGVLFKCAGIAATAGIVAAGLWS